MSSPTTTSPPPSDADLLQALHGSAPITDSGRDERRRRPPTLTLTRALSQKFQQLQQQAAAAESSNGSTAASTTTAATTTTSTSTTASTSLTVIIPSDNAASSSTTNSAVTSPTSLPLNAVLAQLTPSATNPISRRSSMFTGSSTTSSAATAALKQYGNLRPANMSADELAIFSKMKGSAKRKNTIVVSSQNDIFAEFQQVSKDNNVTAGVAASSSSTVISSTASSSSNPPLTRERHRSRHTRNRSGTAGVGFKDDASFATAAPSAAAPSASHHQSSASVSVPSSSLLSQTLPASFLSSQLQGTTKERETGSSTNSPRHTHVGSMSGINNPHPPLHKSRPSHDRGGGGTNGGSGRASRRNSESTKNPALKVPAGRRASGSAALFQDGLLRKTTANSSKGGSKGGSKGSSGTTTPGGGGIPPTLLQQQSHPLLNDAFSKPLDPNDPFLQRALSSPVHSPLISSLGTTSSMTEAYFSPAGSGQNTPAQPQSRRLLVTESSSFSPQLNSVSPPQLPSQLVSPSSQIVSPPSGRSFHPSFSADPMDFLTSPSISSHPPATDPPVLPDPRLSLATRQSSRHSNGSDLLLNLPDGLKFESMDAQASSSSIGQGLESPNDTQVSESSAGGCGPQHSHEVSLKESDNVRLNGHHSKGPSTSLSSPFHIMEDCSPSVGAITIHIDPAASNNQPSTDSQPWNSTTLLPSPDPFDPTRADYFRDASAEVDGVTGVNGLDEDIDEGEEYDEEYEPSEYSDEEQISEGEEEEEDVSNQPQQPTVLSTEESLAELELVKMSPWTLRFENAKMEAIFEKHFSSKLSENFLFLNLLVVGQHIFLGVIEYVTDTTEQIELPIFLFRIIIIAIFLTSAGFTWIQKLKGERVYERMDEEEESDQTETQPEPAASEPQTKRQLFSSGSFNVFGNNSGINNQSRSNLESDVDPIHWDHQSGIPASPSKGFTFEQAHQQAREIYNDADMRQSQPSEESVASTKSDKSNSSTKQSPQPSDSTHSRLYLLKLIVLLNFLQGAMMLIAFTLASQMDVDDGVTIHSQFTLYSPSSGELSTAFSLVLYGFIFIGSGMLLVYAVPLSLLYFLSSLIISTILRSPTGNFFGSIVLQLFFLILCTWNMYSMERQTRKELILLCTVARDRARGNDLINNMLPPSMVLRLQIMQQHYEQNLIEEEQRNQLALIANGGAVAPNPDNDAEVEVEDSQGNIVMRRVSTQEPTDLVSSSTTSPQSLPSPIDHTMLHSTHFYDVYEHVTILFCYLSSFVDLVCYMDPPSLVKLLNDIYTAFDDSILTFAGMYKVEAIAETYMAVSGCPFVNTRHAQTVAEFALNMMEIISRNMETYENTLAVSAATTNNASSSPRFQRAGSGRRGVNPFQRGFSSQALTMQTSKSDLGVNEVLITPPADRHPAKVSIQVGIHSGPIAAGVIGIKTLSYHLFGDAVNTASRMCSTSSPNHIQCSQATEELLHDEFSLEPLGAKNIKGKGMMETFFVKAKLTKSQMRRRQARANAALNNANNTNGANSTEGSYNHIRNRSTYESLVLDGPQENPSHPVPLSPRNLLHESSKQEAARHAVDSFTSIVASTGHHQPNGHIFGNTAYNRSTSPTNKMNPPSPAHLTRPLRDVTGGEKIELTVLSASPVAPIDYNHSASPNLSISPPTALIPSSTSPPTLATPIPPNSSNPLGARSVSVMSNTSSGTANGTSSSLQFVAEFPASTWTLRLSEPALEEEFHTGYLIQTHQQLRIILPMLFLFGIIYLVGGAITTHQENIKYFLPQMFIGLSLLVGLWYVVKQSEQHDANEQAKQTHDANEQDKEANEEAGVGEPLTNETKGKDQTSSPISPASATNTTRSHSPNSSHSNEATASFFHRHDQLLIGAVVSSIMICINMSGLYTHSHGGYNYDSSGDGALISNFETLVNFNILALMAIFFVLRLYYRNAWLVAMIVWCDLVIVFGCSGSSLRSSIMSLSVVAVCTALSAYAQYHREYTMRFDFLLERVLMHEKNNLFQLLQNMLPSPRHAHKLMTGEQVVEIQNSVTLLYSDIRGFTEISTKMPPQDLCTLLNSFYSAFDEHLDIRGVYKIDTIGDAFVVVGGLAIENSTVDHASAIADFALDMLGEIEHVQQMWKQIPEANELIQSVTMRIGIHTGSVIAATVGLIRPKYLLFGRDTLIANKMESEGIPGQIQVSQATYDKLSPSHTHLMENRGEIDLGLPLGKMNTYLLKGRFFDVLRATRGRFAHGEKAKEENEQLGVNLGGIGGMLAIANDAAHIVEPNESSRLLDEERKDATPRESFFNTKPGTRRQLSQPLPGSRSFDDSSINPSFNRAARSLAKQIAHVRGLSRELPMNTTDWDLNTFAMPQRKSVSSRRMSVTKSMMGTAANSARPSVVLQVPSPVPDGQLYSPMVVIDSVNGGSGGNSQTTSNGVTPTTSMPVTPRSSIVHLPGTRAPHRRSFTLANVTTQSLQLPQGSATQSKSGIATPSSSISNGLPSVASALPTSVPSQSRLIGTEGLGRTSLSIDRQQSQPLQFRPRANSFSAQHLHSGGGGLPMTRSAAASIVNESDVPSALGARRYSANQDDVSFHDNGPRQRRSLVAAAPTPPPMFQRGIALHHRRSSSVLFTPQQLAAAGNSTSGSTRMLNSGSNSGQASVAHSRGGSIVGLPPSGLDEPSMNRSRSARPSLKISVSNPNAAPMIRQQSDKTLPTTQATRLKSRPSARRIRSVATESSPGPASAIAEEPHSAGTAKLMSAGRSTPDTVKLARAASRHARSSSALTGTFSPVVNIAPATTPHPSTKPLKRGNTSPILPGAATPHRTRSVRKPPSNQLRGTGANHHLNPSSSSSSSTQLRDSPMLTSFDDTHVEVKALRTQHERDLDGQMSVTQYDRVAQYAQQLWQQKLELLASRRAEVSAQQAQQQQIVDSNATTASTTPVLEPRVTSTSPPGPGVTILVNDEPPTNTTTNPMTIDLNSIAYSTLSPPSLSHVWSSGLSPVPDVNSASLVGVDESPVSPLTVMLERMDEAEVANTDSSIPVPTASPASLPEQPTMDAAHIGSSDEHASESDTAFSSLMPRAISAPMIPGLGPKKALRTHQSISSTRLSEHLDTLHSITASRQTTDALHLNDTDNSQPPSTVNSAPHSPPQPPTSTTTTTAPVPVRAPPIGPPNLTSLTRHLSLGPSNSSNTSPNPIRDPIARDEVELEILRSSNFNLADCLPTTLPASGRALSRGHSRAHSRQVSQGGGGANMFHSQLAHHVSLMLPETTSFHHQRSRSTSQNTTWTMNAPSMALSSSDALPNIDPNGELIMDSILLNQNNVNPLPPQQRQRSRSNSAVPGVLFHESSRPGSRRHSFSGVEVAPNLIQPALISSLISSPSKASARVSSGNSGGSISLIGQVSGMGVSSNSGGSSVANSVTMSHRRLGVDPNGSIPPSPLLAGIPSINSSSSSSSSSSTPQLSATSLHASPIQAGSRPSTLLLNQLKVIGRSKTLGGNSSNRNLQPSQVASSHLSVMTPTSSRRMPSTGSAPPPLTPISPLVGRLQQQQRGGGAHRHPSRTPSFGGFEIHFRGAHQQPSNITINAPSPILMQPPALRHPITINHPITSAINTNQLTVGTGLIRSNTPNLAQTPVKSPNKRT